MANFIYTFWLSIAVVTCISLSTPIFGQDFHFTQHNLSPLTINPAMAGYMNEGNHRITLKYRDQWSGILGKNSFKTGHFSYDGRVCMDKNFMAFGGSASFDQVGAPPVRTGSYSGVFSYHLKTGNNRFLAGALQGGVLRTQIDFSQLSFNAQYDGELGFNLNSNSFENFDALNSTMLDLGYGLIHYNVEAGWNFGGAIYHLNPIATFGSTPNNVRNVHETSTRGVLHGMYSRKIGTSSKKNADYYIFRGIIMIQNPHWQAKFSAERKFNFFEKSAGFDYVTFGIGGRLSTDYSDGLISADALFALFRADVSDSFSLGLSYDFTVSKLQQSPEFSDAMEISLTYRFGNAPKCVYCKNF